MTDAGGQVDRSGAEFGAAPRWEPTQPRLRVLSLLFAWLVSAASVYVAAAIVPDVDLRDFWGAFLVAAVIAAVNALLPPLVAALRLPFMLVLGFVSVLLIDAAALVI